VEKNLLNGNFGEEQRKHYMRIKRNLIRKTNPDLEKNRSKRSVTRHQRSRSTMNNKTSRNSILTRNSSQKREKGAEPEMPLTGYNYARYQNEGLILYKTANSAWRLE